MMNILQCILSVCYLYDLYILLLSSYMYLFLLQGIFSLVISMFSELADTGNPYFSKRVKILETFSRCKCSLIMLDAACSDLILQMFNTLFSAVRSLSFSLSLSTC